MMTNDADFERQYAKATRRGEDRLRYQPRAIAVRYDRRLRKVVVDLSNGCSLLVPPNVAQGLTAASASELSDARVLGPGTTIVWPRLDVHFSVAGLLIGNFGTRSWMRKLQGRAGHPKSAAKSHKGIKLERRSKKASTRHARA